MIAHVGFYLDDWATLSFLHFAPREDGLLGLWKNYLLSDGRVLIRPIEVIHYGTIFWFAGLKPYAYHLVNLVFEILAAFFAFLCLRKLSGVSSLSLVAAIFILLHPGHDSSRYWVICTSVSLSLALYFVSFFASLKGLDRKGTGSLFWHAAAGFFFLLSLLNYETFLPLAALSVLSAFYTGFRESAFAPGDWQGSLSKLALLKRGLARALPVLLSLVLPLVLLLIYLKIIVPLFGHGYAHPVKLDAKVMLDTVFTGLALNTPWQAGAFFLTQARDAVSTWTSGEIVRLLLIALISGGSVYLLNAFSLKAPDTGRLRPLDLISLGIVSMVASYTIFGLSPDYKPTYLTLVNRVNTGASVSAALILLGLLLLLGKFSVRLRVIVPVVAAVFFAAFFTLADWGLAKPWITSWYTQRTIFEAISKKRDEIPRGSSVLLVNCPRYALWSPVFDGVWDFQNMLRIITNDKSASGNVVSERLSVEKGALVDVSYNYECGRYPFKSLFLLVAPGTGGFIRCPDGGTFVSVVEREGMTFGLDKKVLSKWRSQIGDSLNASK